MAPEDLKLSSVVTSPTDIRRLSRELAELDEALLQLKLRESGSQVKLPKTTSLLDHLAKDNKLNLLHKTDRAALTSFLAQLKDAPVIHMSFSAEPSVSFLDQLILWLRQEIDPHLLLSVGLQPTIGAGCIVRTNNHSFDLSLKQTFIDSRKQLLNMLISSERPEAKAATN